MAASDSEPAAPSAKPKVPPTFLTLPPEIRNYIYDLAIFNISFIGAPRPIQLITVGNQTNRTTFSNYPPTFNSTISLTEQVRFSFSEEGLECPENDEPPCSTPHNLFSTCRQIHRETRETYYSCNIFVVQMTPAGISTFKDWLHAIGEDGCDLIHTLMTVFTDPGDENSITVVCPARIFVLDLSTKTQPRTIIPFTLNSNTWPASNREDVVAPGKPFQDAMTSMPLLRFLMADPGYDAASAEKRHVWDHEHDVGSLQEWRYDRPTQISALLYKEWRLVLGLKITSTSSLPLNKGELSAETSIMFVLW